MLNMQPVIYRLRYYCYLLSAWEKRAR